MKKRLVLAVYLGATLLGGCSSKPDVGDIEGVLKEAWEPCKLVKLTNLKKTNGVDHGNSYQMAISYKAEITRDVAKEDFWFFSDSMRIAKFADENCPFPASILYNSYFIDNLNPVRGLKKGETRDIPTEYTMIKSENGWIVK